jgi:RNA polymerase sigma-70 factor (ECF subfamily)
MSSRVQTPPVALAAPPSAACDEAALVAAAKSDRRAFGALYDCHVRAVYGYCFHQLGSREAAEDATSLIFTKALGALPSQRGSSFRGWLFGIAHHVVADAIQQKCADMPLEMALEMSDVTPSPESAAIVNETRRTLYAALAQLSTEQRQVVELRLAGLTSAEIGQVLGRSRGAVDVAQHRAVLRLRGLLGATPQPEVMRHER